MTIFSPSNLERALESSFLAVDAKAAHDLRRCETTMVEALTEIVRRAERMLRHLEDDNAPWLAVFDAVQGAGASGPIGSQWERVLDAASRARAISEFATTHTAPVAEEVEA